MDVPQPRRSFSDDLRARVLSRVIGYRERLAPILLVMALLFAALDPTPFRIAIFLVPALAIVVLIGHTRRLRARGESTEETELRSALVTGAMQLWVIFATGGIASPLLPALLILTVVISITLEPRGSIAYVFGIQLPTIWLFAVVHWAGWVPQIVVRAFDGLIRAPGSGGPGPFVAAGFLSVALAGASTMGRILRQTIGDLADERTEDRTRTLGQLAESARAMSALSGEIAHELKNPLASIKGLAALVRKDLDGRTAERMDVLRAEVDRMQTILDDFLAHARPLVPLAIEEVDALALARDVAAMHEGTASERDLRVVTRGEPVRVRCDPRKIRQIAINLVQNALDASPAGATVELVVNTTPEGGCALVVRDRGKGLDGAMRDRLFEVGATTKPRGTGLGLVVARGLARQHGGELSLEDAAGGGCEATLTLPADAKPLEAPARAPEAA